MWDNVGRDRSGEWAEKGEFESMLSAVVIEGRVLCSTDTWPGDRGGDICIAGRVFPGSLAFAALIVNCIKPGEVAFASSTDPSQSDTERGVPVVIGLSGGGL